MAAMLGTSTLIQSMEAMTSAQVYEFLLQVSLGVREEQYPV